MNEFDMHYVFFAMHYAGLSWKEFLTKSYGRKQLGAVPAQCQPACNFTLIGYMYSDVSIMEFLSSQAK